MKDLRDQVDAFRIWERTHNRENYGRYDAFKAGYDLGRNEALEEAVKAAEAAKCGSETPWDCGCTPGIKAIRALALAAKGDK